MLCTGENSLVHNVGNSENSLVHSKLICIPIVYNRNGRLSSSDFSLKEALKYTRLNSLKRILI